MPPEETQNQPANGQPRPSQRTSYDGVSPRPIQRPIITGRENQRPFAGQRPAAAPAPTAMPAPPPAGTPQMPAPQSETPPAPTPASQPLQFTPPSSKKRRWKKVLLPLAIVFVILLISGGVFAWMKVQAAKNNPDTAFKDALVASLQTKQIEADTTSGPADSQAQFDFSSMTNPLVSTQATFTLHGENFSGTGYGSLKNTYFSYTKLPSSVPASVAGVTLNAWVQLRTQGTLPAGVNPTLVNASDPRYQDYGPVLFGNYPLKTSQQLASFLITNHAYRYQTSRVTHTQLANTKVFAYPVKLDVGFIKIAAESAALTSKLTPADLQNALDAYEALRGASGTIYVDRATHHIQEITLQKNGQTTTVAYSHYGNLSLPGEPQTKLTWQYFAPLEAQIEAGKKK